MDTIRIPLLSKGLSQMAWLVLCVLIVGPALALLLYGSEGVPRALPGIVIGSLGAYLWWLYPLSFQPTSKSLSVQRWGSVLVEVPWQDVRSVIVSPYRGLLHKLSFEMSDGTKRVVIEGMDSSTRAELLERMRDHLPEDAVLTVHEHRHPKGVYLNRGLAAILASFAMILLPQKALQSSLGAGWPWILPWIMPLTTVAFLCAYSQLSRFRELEEAEGKERIKAA